MIHAEIDICIIDDTPIDQSEVYRVIKQECGEEIANKWTRTVVVPPWEEDHVEVADRTSSCSA